jgi:formate hydrogenlyase subunit 3/multisubunit Na+/H+ antiporter MnhD subunit
MSGLIENFYPILILDDLSRFIVWAIILFGVLITLYSIKFMKGKSDLRQYYLYIILTVIASIGVVLANNLILLLVLWGFLGLSLYLLINFGGRNANSTAKKALIIIGGSDSLMILSIGILYMLTGTFQMDKIRVSIDTPLASLAYVCMALACFAKAGAMPLHSWIPDCAQDAPVSVTAFLPASLDKLLGIYLLARISMDLFVINNAMNLFLMIVGAFTIIAAVMMALVQHDLKRLLGYHAVSQVGYMVLGIGTGTSIGIAGGIFHMLNHAIYKCCLFLTGGSVEYRTNTTELHKLGGLAKFMPITFLGCLIASLSISGVPPFNGFISKWMVYQGLIQRIGSQQSSFISVLCLLAAMFGSALTLASFLKLLHSTFLGTSSRDIHNVKEVAWLMWLPIVVLAGLCVLFGVFAYAIPLNNFILPIVGKIEFIGFWAPGWATSLIIIGIIIGFIIYSLNNTKKLIREDSSFIGGESLLSEERISGVDFYDTIKNLSRLKSIYRKAEDKVFDIYEQGRKLIFYISRKFQYLHNGILPRYLVWCMLGMMILFIILFKNG